LIHAHAWCFAHENSDECFDELTEQFSGDWATDNWAIRRGWTVQPGSSGQPARGAAGLAVPASLLGGQQSLFGVRMTVQKAGETAVRRRPPLGCQSVYSHSEQNIPRNITKRANPVGAPVPAQACHPGGGRHTLKAHHATLAPCPRTLSQH
jgi:hypothetical protein